ncbi:glucosamine-6-phosphate deaminase [Jeotgalibacillus soli]|uniref:Glucosamine-6-phosphate deaminase n=1 Tax=Jeotgalibacillus soli TaxID=889306 RepID=A0A0C2RIS8_9BACL|nr:glucosamine-6-phosphate deaminase [Jeotgalibacillus soli]KIL50050.1 glucosamine-6-phosphate deaminase [Jeotgalibacillus soli]
MKLVKVKNYEELSAFAAEKILEKVRSSNRVSLGLATGGTPVRTYELLIDDFKKRKTSYQHVHTYNLDEYVGIAADAQTSYQYYMFEHLFNHIDIPKENVHLPNGTAENILQETQRYEDAIDKLKGVDLQLLGIGENGHIGFNEPGTPFDRTTHVTELEESTREANSRYFNSLDEVPTHAITMGIATILKSKEIVLLASGEKKAEALYQMFNGEISNNCPASVLRNHPNVIVVADEQAASKLEKLSTVSN